MRLHHFTHLGFVALVLTSACAGGQTGDLSGEHPDTGTEGNASGCEEHKQKLADFDTMTDSGTAEQVLAYAEKSFDAPITWKEAPAGQAWTAGPESGTGELHIAVTRGESAYALTYTQKASDSGIELANVCPPPQLGVEVHVNVTTDGGALAESFDTLLRTSAPGVATMSVPLDLTKVGGSLAVSSTMARAKLVQMSLDATFMAEGTTGRISGIQQIDSGTGVTGASSAGQALLAVWPDSAACRQLFQDGAGLGVTVDQTALGETGTATLASVALAEPTSITWSDGSATTLTVAIEPSGDGCFRVNSLPVEAGGGATVTYPVTIAAKSDDGRLDGTYAGQVIVSGAGSERTVSAAAYLDISVTDVAQSGFAGVSVPASSDGLRLRIESNLSDGSVAGMIQLFSVENPPCLTEPVTPMVTPGGGMSVPGCPGQAQTRLESAAWTK
jgi:hypothetical protein